MEISRCIFTLKKMHRNDKMVVLRLILHKGPLHNKMWYIARFQLFATEYNKSIRKQK